MNSGMDILIREQYQELAKTFPDLKLCEDAPGHWTIRGTLSFSATFEGEAITDAFSILITIPGDYPDSPPAVQETGGRIPADFHQYPDRTLCLGAPVEVYRRFKADPRLLAFVETLVVEYLYGYVHWEKHGTLPFGELSHGCKGIREYYQDILNTSDVQVVLALLRVLADGTYRGHHRCPCGSRQILRKCHGPTLLALQENQPKERFIRDATNVLYSLDECEMEHFDWDLLPTMLKRKLDDVARERSTNEKCA